MNRGILILFLGIAAALAAFALTHRQCGCSSSPGAFIRDGATRLPELVWLRHELKLNDAQFAKVQELHLTHRPACAVMCARIESSRRRVGDLVVQGDTDSPALSAALSELAEVEKECRQAFYRHVHRTAAELSPEQARAYYRIVLPQLSAESGPTPGHAPGTHP